MYKKINMTENTLQVLSLFTNDFSSEYYVREVAKLLKISPRTAQLILEELENKGVVISKHRGKIKNYKLFLSEQTKRYLALAEQYKAISFFEDNHLIKEVIDKATLNISGIALIFGSYAKGLQKKGSDLDIFVVGNYSKERIQNISDKYNIELSVKCYPPEIFTEKLSKDFLIKEVLKNHIIFLNAEQFVQLILQNGKDWMVY